MKILVCGGRDYGEQFDRHGLPRDNWVHEVNKLNAVLDAFWKEHRSLTHVIHGGARGADSLAGSWARRNGIQEVRCEANWDYHERRAGYIRNQAMLDLLGYRDMVIAFPGGSGTADMVRRAKQDKDINGVIEIKDVSPEDQSQEQD